jgi:hypothetical protein
MEFRVKSVNAFIREWNARNVSDVAVGNRFERETLNEKGYKKAHVKRTRERRDGRRLPVCLPAINCVDVQEADAERNVERGRRAEQNLGEIRETSEMKLTED